MLLTVKISNIKNENIVFMKEDVKKMIGVRSHQEMCRRYLTGLI